MAKTDVTDVECVHLSQWQCCPTTVSSDPCVCLCVWVGGAHSCMHALVCCQLAECRPWRHCCTMTCTNIEITQKAHSLHYHSACVHLLSVSLPVSAFILVLCASLISMCLWWSLSLSPVFSISRLLPVFFIFIHSPLCFLRHQFPLYSISYVTLHCGIIQKGFL